MYFLDYSSGKLSGATIRANNYNGVIRYIDSPLNLSTKHTSLSEYQDHIAQGLVVRLVMQVNTTDADGGYARGVAYAQRAKAGADYLGYHGRIFFTNDRTTVPDPSTWRAYLDGAVSVLGLDRVGAYGFRNAIDTAQGHASAFWQAGARSALSPAANYWQDNNTQVTVGGILCDRNLVISQEGNDVALTDQDVYKIWRDPLLTLDPVHAPNTPINAANVLDRLLNNDAALKAKLDTLSTPTVDLDALAAKVAALLGPTLAAAVADEFERRLAS